MKPAIQIVLASLVLLLAGCTSNQVLTLLERVVSTSEALLPVISASAGLDAQAQANIKKYLDAVGAAGAQASEILAGPGTGAEKAAQITAAFAGISLPILPAGTPQRVASLVQNVASAIISLIANLKTAPPQHITVSAANHAKLAAIQDRALTVQESVSGTGRVHPRMRQ